MMLSAAACQSQRIIEKLPDGSIRVEIDGKQYLAITRAQLDAWQILQNNFDAVKQDLKDQQRLTELAEAKRNEALAQKDLEAERAVSFEKDFNVAKEEAKRNYGLFLGERALRQEASQFIPRGQSHGFAAKMLDFLNSQGFQIAWKIGQPSVQTFLVARCQK